MQCWWLQGAGQGIIALHFKAAKTRAEGGLIPQVQPYYHLVANWQNFSLVASPVMVQWPSSHFLFTLLPCTNSMRKARYVSGRERDGFSYYVSSQCSTA